MSHSIRANAPAPWKSNDEPELSRETLLALLNDEIPAIRVRGFATSDECASVVEAIRDVGMQHVYHFKSADGDALSDVTTGYIGLTHYNYRHKPKSAYFDAVPDAYAYRNKVFEKSFDAVQRMIDLLQAVSETSVGVARETDGAGDLYAGIIRDASTGGDLHADFAPYTARGLCVGQIDAQISWNAWFEHPENGGGTTVHHQPWTAEFDGDDIPEQYPLDRALVEGAETHIYRPSPGDAILFNTRNPHEIAGAAPGDTHSRLQVGSFIGRMPKGDLALWS
jgi:hypothetical protein